MSDTRRKEREGRHVSVGGAAADEVLQGLVQQFSDRYAFIRELIQNSLDAGSARIDVRMTYDGRELRIEVQDDGEGMDRPIIEGYLLTLFRSTKEDDLTKIGKFGIGFTSIFAMDPVEVIVDTGRDGVWHRVTFDENCAYTLTRRSDPYEGTTVTLRLPRKRADANEDVRKVRAAAERWCRYADAAITVSAEGTEDEWDAQTIAAPFTVDAPVTIVEEADGFRAVLGPYRRGKAPVGFYNRGITLWEGEDRAIPGVTFRVAGRHLEHTLTRDNVIRDRHHEAVMERLQVAARTRLGDAVHTEAAAAATTGDLARAARLFAAIARTVPWTWREEAPLVPGIGRALSLRDIRGSRGWLGRIRGAPATVWWATHGCVVGAALAAEHAVVLADEEDAPHLAWVAGQLEGARRAAIDGWVLATRAEPIQLLAATIALAASRGDVVEGARFSGGALGDRLALCLPEPWALTATPLPSPKPRWPLLVNVDHPLLPKLARLPDDVGAPLLLHAARAAAGLPVRPSALLVDELAAALGGRVAPATEAS